MRRSSQNGIALLLGAGVATLLALRIDPVLGFICAASIAWGALALANRNEPDPDAALAEEEEAGAADGADPAFPVASGRLLVEKLPVPLLILSRTGRLTYANLAAQLLLPRLVIGQHFAHIIRAPAFVEAISATLADGCDRSFEFTSYEGNERHFEARASMTASDGQFGPEASVIVQVEDRTQAHKAEQLRSDFIANASHELRTPLASIIGYIETLQNHARDDPEARERFLSIMARESHRMQRLVDDLMSLSRIELNEHVNPVERLSLSNVAIDCASVFQAMAEREGVRLVVELEPDESEVIGDRDQLAQVFTNLIDNAMKYSGTGAEIRVHRAEPSPAHPGRIGISVSDTGPGIPRDKIHRLTERFFRVSVNQSRNKGGTGLGLAIVKHILNRHKGRIEILSEIGRGSTFTVWLPRAASGGQISLVRPRGAA